MKKAGAVLLAFLLLLLTACGGGGEPVSSEKEDEVSAVTEKELKAAQQALDGLLLALQGRDIQSVELLVPTRSEPQRYSGTGTQLIVGWLALLEKLELEPVAFSPADTVGFGLFFAFGGEEASVGTFVNEWLYTESNRVMFRIKNYAAVSDELSGLVAQMRPAEEGTTDGAL